MTTLDTQPSHSSIAPLLQTLGSGFPPLAIEAVWLSQSEISVALSNRWAIIPGQAVRVTGPITSETETPEWQAVARVTAIQPYLDSQRVYLSPCWGTLAANASWLEGLARPIEFLCEQHSHQHTHQNPSANPMQLLGQPIGIASTLQSQGWRITGTCVSGKQAILKDLLTGFKTGWVLDGSGWYDSVFSSSNSSSASISITPEERFELARQLCHTASDFLSPDDKTALMQASTIDTPTLSGTLKTFCEALPHLPIIPSNLLEGPYWNVAAVPVCWQRALAQLWVQAIHRYQPPVVVVVWPEALGLDVSRLFSQWQEQGTCVIWLPLGRNQHDNHLNSQWQHVSADIAWPLTAMESDALGSITATDNVPYDVTLSFQGPTSWQLPVTWTLPGEVLASGPIEWQSYGVQQPTQQPIQQRRFVHSQRIEEALPEPAPLTDAEEAAAAVMNFEHWNPENLEIIAEPQNLGEQAVDIAAHLPSDFMGDLGPLPDLSDLTSDLSALGSLATFEDAPSHSDADTLAATLDEAPADEPLSPPTVPSQPSLLIQESLPVLETFTEGQQVQHAKYGVGTVVQVIPTGSRYTLQVAFTNAGTRLLDSAQSGLQPA